LWSILLSIAQLFAVNLSGGTEQIRRFDRERKINMKFKTKHHRLCRVDDRRPAKTVPSGRLGALTQAMLGLAAVLLACTTIGGRADARPEHQLT
jgi:hypothetical protein